MRSSRKQPAVRLIYFTKILSYKSASLEISVRSRGCMAAPLLFEGEACFRLETGSWGLLHAIFALFVNARQHVAQFALTIRHYFV